MENINSTTESREQEKKDALNWIIPGAIILAGVIIAGAIIYTSDNKTGGPADTAGDQSQKVGDLVSVNNNDHILGNPDAPVVIVEFSDLECPFCKSFHGTMKQVMEKYGDSGKVAWVYRHFPLSIHPKAEKEAEATECAAELGGKVAFWEYTDKIFEITPSNNGLDLTLLPQIAEEIGIDRNAFEACLQSDRHASSVNDDLEDALRAGGRGTPFSIILTKDGKTVPISGAQPFETVDSMIEDALATIE